MAAWMAAREAPAVVMRRSYCSRATTPAMRNSSAFHLPIAGPCFNQSINEHVMRQRSERGGREVSHACIPLSKQNNT